MADIYKSFKFTVISSNGVRTEIPSILRTTGEITKTVLGYPNQATFDIFNLDEETRSIITSGGMDIELYGGELGKEKFTFRGDIINANTIQQDLDLVTTIYARDGGRAWNNSLIGGKGSTGVAYEGQVPLSTVLREVALYLDNVENVSFENASKFLDKQVIIKNYTATGKASDVLKQLVKSVDDKGTPTLYFSIQDGTCSFVDADTIFENEGDVVLDDPSKIIGVPVLDVWTVNVDTHFKPTINIYQSLKIASEFSSSQVGNMFFVNQDSVTKGVNGVYNIATVIHTFDSRGASKTKIRATYK